MTKTLDINFKITKMQKKIYNYSTYNVLQVIPPPFSGLGTGYVGNIGGVTNLKTC